MEMNKGLSYSDVETWAANEVNYIVIPQIVNSAEELPTVYASMAKAFLGDADVIKDVASHFNKDEEEVAKIVNYCIKIGCSVKHETIKNIVDQVTDAIPGFKNPTINEHTREYNSPSECKENFENDFNEFEKRLSFITDIFKLVETLPKESYKLIAPLVSTAISLWG